MVTLPYSGFYSLRGGFVIATRSILSIYASSTCFNSLRGGLVIATGQDGGGFGEPGPVSIACVVAL